MTDCVLQGVNDARGLQAEVQTDGRNERFQSRGCEDRKPEATQWRATEGRYVSTSICLHPIGVL
jgi:hypothetical protein